ncbi:MAG TPA: hypothetical protein VIG25_09045 [Pyrinomonadaceae bacterium]|jgi:hypothetical protein
MISRIKIVVISTALFICNPVIHTSHAQQAPTETQAVQVIGLAGVKEKTKGRLTLVNGSLRFIYDRGNAEVSAASIQDVVTGRDSQRAIGGTLGTLTVLAPFGSGRALSLFRKKLDTLTIQYRDSDGGLHGVIFTVPLGKAEIIKQELISHGAQTSIPTQPDPGTTTSDAKEKKP